MFRSEPIASFKNEHSLCFRYILEQSGLSTNDELVSLDKPMTFFCREKNHEIKITFHVLMRTFKCFKCHYPLHPPGIYLDGTVEYEVINKEKKWKSWQYSIKPVTCLENWDIKAIDDHAFVKKNPLTAPSGVKRATGYTHTIYNYQRTNGKSIEYEKYVLQEAENRGVFLDVIYTDENNHLYPPRDPFFLSF